MKYTNITTTLKRVSGLSLFAAGALLASQAALGCQTSAWSVTDGAVTAGDPAVEGIARYQGLCGLEVTDSGFVQDNSPNGIDRIVARFYVLKDSTAPATIDIYGGFSANDGTGEVFNVTLDAAGVVRLTDTTTSDFVEQGGSTNWLSVEIDWARGAGDGVISLSVNGQPAVENTSVGNGAAAALQSVRLGNLNGAAGTLGFDSYESRRSTAVGRLVVADANNDGNLSTGDLVAVRNELLAPAEPSALASGTPDCNEDGGVSTGDLVCIRNILLAP